jgi:hypothetical protein
MPSSPTPQQVEPAALIELDEHGGSVFDGDPFTAWSTTSGSQRSLRREPLFLERNRVASRHVSDESLHVSFPALSDHRTSAGAATAFSRHEPSRSASIDAHSSRTHRTRWPIHAATGTVTAFPHAW